MDAQKLEFMVEYVRRATALADPEIEKDPAYVFSDEDISNIIKMCTSQQNPNYTLENFPDNELPMLAILARKEIYWRLATSSAKFYPISAEGAELKKNYRFTHYSKLIQLANTEYQSVKAEFNFQNPNSIQTGVCLVDRKHFSPRQRNIQNIPKVGVKILEVTSNSIGVQWDKFNCMGGIFGSYSVYCSESPVYDEYEYKILTNEVAYITDINKLRVRIKDLKPNTKYYIAVATTDINLLKGVTTLEVTTMPKEGDCGCNSPR